MSFLRFLPASLVPGFVLGAPLSVFAGTLELKAAGTINVSALPITTAGDVGFADGRIWISDATNGGQVYAVSTVGTLLNTIDPGVVPGLLGGPDAICTIGATGLCVFSSFGESVAGRLRWTDGTLSSTFVSANEATGADFNGTGLWIASGASAGIGSTLLRLDTNDGSILATVPVPGLNVRITDLTLDPFSGALYALCEDDQLREIDVATGAILATQNLGPFLIGNLFVAGGLDFDSFGTKLYVFTGNGPGADAIVVLDRDFSASVCGSGIGAFPCPCANAGNPGRGCRNSVPGSTGASIDTTGIPRISQDTLVLQAQGLPTGSAVLFFQTDSVLAAPSAFGDGVLCGAGAIVRLGVKSAPSGTAHFPETGDAAVHAQGSITAGPLTRAYQGWYRDAASFCTASTFNLTNAVSVEWR